MTVNVSKSGSNLREQLSELNRPVGSHGSQLMKSANTAESFDLVRAGRKNLIINGSCMIDQRNSGSSVTTGYAVDRTHVEGFYGAGTGTAQQVSDAPAGLFKSLKITVTGTDTSLGSTDFYTLRHIIEGQNVAHLGFGTNNAKTVTLSFWVKSSISGIFCCSLGNGTNNKTMPREYHIDNPNKWEYKTLTFAPAITGTWGTDNGRGFSVRWCMGVGSQRRGTVDTYNGNESHGTTKQTNLFATNGATFQITGMQLEEGNAATPFEHRSYGEELLLCQRYYIKYIRRPETDTTNFITTLIAGSGDDAFGVVNLPVPMRANPTLDYSHADHFETSNIFSTTNTVGGSFTSAYSMADGDHHAGIRAIMSPNPSFSAGSGRILRFKANLDGWIHWSAEM
tara:strand:- start:152 stop:1336 length:1185 start_codon:yes stop_codon:yes gene_type:complete